MRTLQISQDIAARGLTALDVVRALALRGHREMAENLMSMLRQRVSGDYLQTSAIVRDGRVVSAVNDPNAIPARAPATTWTKTGGTASKRCGEQSTAIISLPARAATRPPRAPRNSTDRRGRSGP